MLETLSLEAYEWVSYPHVQLRFDAPLIVVRGLNLDAASHEDAANRTGKSLVPAILPRLRYDAVPQPVKAPRKAKHAFRKGTRLIWDLKRGENRYRLEKYLDRTARVRIIEDKRNRGIRLKTTGDEALEEIFPLNEDQFYSTVYIDARRPSLLQYGSDADRFRFFEQVFDLGVYRQLNDALKPEVQSLARSTSERDILRDQLQALGELPDTQHLNTGLRLAENRLAEQRKKVEIWRSHKRRLEIYCDALKQIPPGKPDDIDVLHDEMAALSLRIDNGIAAEEQARLYAETQDMRTRLDEALKSYADIQIDTNLPNAIEALRDSYQVALKEQQEYQENLDALNEATRALAGIKAEDKAKRLTLPQLERERIKAHSRIEFITRLQTALSGSIDHEKTCPVCASEFSDDKHAAFEARIEKNLNAAKAKARIIHDAIRWNKQNAIVQDLGKRCAHKPEFDCESLARKLEADESRLEKMQRKAKILRRLKSLPVTAKPAVLEDLPTLRAKNRALLDRVNTAQRIQQARTMIASLKLTVSEADAKKALRRYTQLLPENETQLEALEHKVITLKTRLSEAASVTAQIEKTTQDLAALETTLEDQPILDALRVAFGPKGLVKQRTQRLAASFQNALNEYSPFIYDESVTFRLDVTETKFSIFATRNGIEDDVRSFSGQESRAFSLITMLSLLRFMPNHLRCDMIMLDEIEANMDASSRRLFVEKFIPELQRFVKKILIVTPLSRADFHIPDCEEYYAIKSKGKSELVPFRDLETYRRNLETAPRSRGHGTDMGRRIPSVARSGRKSKA